MTESSKSKKPLTALDVKRHRYSEVRVECFLADGPPHQGLRLVANKNGSKTWVYRYRAGKKLKQVKLGEYPSMELSQARKAFLEAKALKVANLDPQEEKIKRKREAERARLEEESAAYSVRHMVEDYLVEHILHNRREKGQVECRRMLEKDVLPEIGALAVTDVKRHHIHELVQKIALRAPRIAGMVKVELKGAFEHAILAGRVSFDFVNPTFGVKSPKFKARRRVLSDSELEQFLKWLPSSKISPTIKSVLMLILLTGARGGEVVAMKWSALDFERAEWFMESTKNGRSHTVYLSSRAVELIKKIKRAEESDFLFPSPISNKHIRQHAIVWQVEKHRDSLGIPHWTSHDLRRTMGTGLAKLGCPRVVQDRVLNHVDSSVSAVYDRHSYDHEARGWWEKWSDHLDALEA